MIIKNTIKTEVSTDDDTRYYLKIEWNKDLPCATVIMLTAGVTDGICFDKSTSLCLSNLISLGYGSCYVVKLFSNSEITTADDEENLKAIKYALSKSDAVIYAAGTGKDCNKKVVHRKMQIMKLLKEADSKIYCIADNDGKMFYHPLCPKVHTWILSEFDVNKICEDEKNGQK